jgi:hypothetical protein
MPSLVRTEDAVKMRVGSVRNIPNSHWRQPARIRRISGVLIEGRKRGTQPLAEVAERCPVGKHFRMKAEIDAVLMRLRMFLRRF